MDFFRDRDGTWWFWFAVVIVIIGSNLVGAITGEGWNDPEVPSSGCAYDLPEPAFEACMENQMQGNDVP